MEKIDILITFALIFVVGVGVCVPISILNSCGCFSNEETRIVIITDKWTDHSNNFYIVDNNDNVYKLLVLERSGYKNYTSYRYKQIIIGNKYKLIVKTPYLVENVLSFSEEEVV